MCEYTERIKEVERVMSGKSIDYSFPEHVQVRFPYRMVREGHCLACGVLIPIDERRPYGRATRSLCHHCYTNMVVNKLNYNCFVCGGLLSHYKTQDQMANPREIKNNIDDGDCLDYFTVVHCKVVGGVDMSFLKDESYNINMQQISWENQNNPTDMSTNIEQLPAEVLKQIDYIRNYSLIDAFKKQYIYHKTLIKTDPNQRFIETSPQGEPRRFQTKRQKKDNVGVRVIKLPEFVNKRR